MFVLNDFKKTKNLKLRLRTVTKIFRYNFEFSLRFDWQITLCFFDVLIGIFRYKFEFGLHFDWQIQPYKFCT